MKDKIKELVILKEYCVSVDDIAMVNDIIHYYNIIVILNLAIEKCIDLKILDLKEKEKKDNESKC